MEITNNYLTNAFLEISDIINQKYDSDVNVLNKKCNSIVTRLYDSVYLISSIKNIKINKFDTRLRVINDNYNKKNSSLEIDLAINKITEEQFLQSKSKLELFYNNSIKEKIKIIEQKKEKYLNKLDSIVLNKSKKNKEKIKLVQKKYDKLAENVELKRKNKMQTLVLGNENELNSLSKKINDIKSKKIENNKFSQSLNTIELALKNDEIKDKKDLLVKYEDCLKKVEKKKEIIGLKNYSFNLKKQKIQASFSSITGPNNQEKTKNWFLNILNDSKLLIIVLAISLIAGVSNNNFFTERTWVSLVSNNIDLAFVVIGMTLIILTGGIDLSVGSSLAFCGAVMVKFLQSGHNTISSLLICILIACVFGMIAGLLISYVKLQPFIVTLVLMLILRGATAIVLGSNTAILPGDTLQFLTNDKLWIFPISVYIFIVVAVIIICILKMYKYGRYVYAVGGNQKSAELSGIPANLIKTSVYAFSGILVAFGTVIYVSKLNTITPSSGNQLELDAIACVALGGTSLLGGKGGVWKSIIGWFCISVLSTAMNIIGISTYYQMIVKGLVILLSVLSDKKLNFYQNMKKSFIKIHYSY